MGGLDLEAEVLRHEISSLFSDQQSRRVGVGPEIVGADTQVNDLEILSAENVETPINDASFFPWLHGARSQAVPGGLDMVGDPVVDGLVVFLGILDILVNLAGVVGIAWLVPSAHVDSNGESVGENALRGLDVKIFRRRGRCRVEARVVGSQFTAESIHSPGDFTSLFVAPTDWSKVSLVVHETTVEIRLDVWVGALDVNLAAGSRVLEILEHRDVLAGRKESVIRIRR